MRIDEHVILAPYTSMRVGGAARFFCEPRTVAQVQEALVWARQSSLKVWVLGGGTNTLVSDAGYDGLVIHPLLMEWRIDAQGIYVGAGVRTSQLAVELARSGYRGFEWAATLPGAIGGAIFGNAGCYDACMADHVLSVDIVNTGSGKLVTLSANECEFEYRNSHFKKNGASGVIVGCMLRCDHGDSSSALTLIKNLLNRRKSTQPQGASSGCFFKNHEGVAPFVAVALSMPSGASSCSAGMLIDRAGLKGMSVGGASVSDVHANFIMNNGSATSHDVKKLADIIQKKVFDNFGVMLSQEVCECGQDTDVKP